jgi:hypothetical protein
MKEGPDIFLQQLQSLWGSTGGEASLHTQSNHQEEKLDWLAEKWPGTGTE